MADPITFFGETADIHDALAGREGDFDRAVAALTKGAQPKIAVVRKNAFRLHRLLAFLADRMGRTVAPRTFSPSPTGNIAERFQGYLEDFRQICSRADVLVELPDDRLAPLLERIQQLSEDGHEIDLLRLLGIVCDEVFVGPHWFVFETINACNANCYYCNIHSPTRTPGKKFLTDRLPISIFTSICDDLASMGTDGLTILANGEPLLHPDFSRMAQYAKGKDLLVDFFTNGLLLNKKVAHSVVEAGVDAAYVTISAGSESSYLALHSRQKPGDFDRVRKNLKHLQSLKEKSWVTRPEVTGVHVICAPNRYEIMEMARQAAELGFSKLRLALIRLDEYNRDLALSPRDIDHLRKQLPELESFCSDHGIALWEGYRFQLEHADDPEYWSGDAFVSGGCAIGWGLGLIKANADLSFCCVVKPIANLKSGLRFREVWNGDFYRRARIAAKDLASDPDVTFTDDGRLYTTACRHCDNHDINAMLLGRLKETGLEEFL